MIYTGIISYLKPSVCCSVTNLLKGILGINSLQYALVFVSEESYSCIHYNISSRCLDFSKNGSIFMTLSRLYINQMSWAMCLLKEQKYIYHLLLKYEYQYVV